MKQAILELIDRNIKELIPTSSFWTSIIDSSKIDVLQELRSEIEKMEDENERIIKIIRRYWENNDGNHQCIYDTALEIIDLI